MISLVLGYHSSKQTDAVQYHSDICKRHSQQPGCANTIHHSISQERQLCKVCLVYLVIIASLCWWNKWVELWNGVYFLFVWKHIHLSQRVL